MPDSAPPATPEPPESQATDLAPSEPKGAVHQDGPDLSKAVDALARRDYGKLREALTSAFTELARTHAGPGLVALGFGVLAGPVGGLVAGAVVQWLSARFEKWLKEHSADEQLKKLVEETKEDAERALLLRDIQGWLQPTLDHALAELGLHSEALCAVIEQTEQHEARLKEVLSRVPDPAADTLAALLQTRRLELPADPSPAQLLDARYGVVPFDDETRSQELTVLQSLCDGDELERVEVQLIVGPGGSGKTRLAMQFCKQLWGRADAHWHAGFLLQEAQADAIAQLTRPGFPALVVIDYAESRNLGPWLKQLMNTENARPKLRILLLARHVGEWWETLAQGDAAVKHLCRHPVLHLQDVRLDDGARERHHGLALAAFADKLRKPAPTPSTLRRDEARYARPLYVHMAALSVLLKSPVPDSASDAHELPWEMVQRESMWWARSEDGLPWGLLRLMAAVTLLGGATTKQFKRLRKDLELTTDESLRGRLARYYPKEKGVGALEPDLLGEALVVHALQHDDTEDDFLDVALHDASSYQLTQALTVLGRIASGYPKPVRQWVQQVIGHNPLHRADAAFTATVAVAERHVDDVLGQELARALEGYEDLALARAWAPQLPHETVAFRELKLWVYRQLAASAENDEDRARRAIELSNALSALDRHEESLCFIQDAVATRRSIAANSLAPRWLGLAKALVNLSTTFEKLRRYEEALLAGQEAVELLKQTAVDHQESSDLELAGALINLGVVQDGLGRNSDSLSSTRQASDLYRRIAQSGAGIAVPGLARALGNLAACHSKQGQMEEALLVAQESVDYYRDLAEQRPDAFLLDLSGALTILGALFGIAEEPGLGLRYTEEATETIRKLAVSRPSSFSPNLAVALGNLGQTYGKLDRKEDALKACSESAAIYRRLAQKRPTVFLPDYAGSLNSLGARLSELGDREKALEVTEEACAVYRQLSQERPGAFLSDLAGTLSNLRADHHALGRKEEALAAAEESCAIYKQLAREHPDTFLPDFAGALNDLGASCSDLGRRESALSKAQEAVAIYKQLSQALPDVFLSKFANALSNLSQFLGNLGRREEALLVSEEVVVTRRKLARARPDAFLPDLARALWNMAYRLAENSRAEEALTVAQESMSIYELLAERCPDAFGGYLSTIQEAVNRLSATQKSP